MDFFGKVEIKGVDKGTSASGDWVRMTVKMSDPNGAQRIIFDVFGEGNITRLQDSGMTNGAVGTIYLFSDVRLGNNGREFLNLRPTRFVPLNTSAAPASAQAGVEQSGEQTDDLEF